MKLGMKIRRITKIHDGLYEHICPKCGSILASASEIELMPEYSICPCDRNLNKIPAYELYTEDGYVMIRRNKFPHFTATLTVGESPSLENIHWLDECTEKDAEKALKKAGIFLKRSKYRNE